MADLPEALLISLFNLLNNPKDLLACGGVCQAWRRAKARAVLPELALGHEDLAWLLQLSPVQMAAVRDVCMDFWGFEDHWATIGPASCSSYSSVPSLSCSGWRLTGVTSLRSQR